MKVIFDYDQHTGLVTSSNGMTFCMMGLIPFSEEEASKPTDIDGMIKLKSDGFTSEEIIEIKKAGIT